MSQTHSNSLKITSGTLRGRTIKTPPNFATHPMGARERLALFNIIGPLDYFDNVLDAFAGSGALGFEALSRGARNVVFVEKDPIAADTIRQNIIALDHDDGTVVLEKPVEELSQNGRYTLILADPPYDDYNPQAVEHLLPMVEKNGIFALSHPATITPILKGFRLIKHASYAGANISVFQKL